MLLIRDVVLGDLEMHTTDLSIWLAMLCRYYCFSCCILHAVNWNDTFFLLDFINQNNHKISNHIFWWRARLSRDSNSFSMHPDWWLVIILLTTNATTTEKNSMVRKIPLIFADNLEPIDASKLKCRINKEAWIQLRTKHNWTLNNRTVSMESFYEAEENRERIRWKKQQQQTAPLRPI